MKQINIAIVNDIHNNVESVHKLRDYWIKHNIETDYLISCGDFASLKPHEQNDSTLVSTALETCKQIIIELETLCPKVLYIPGNHDPSYLYTNSLTNHISLTPNAINLHKNVYRMADNLIVVGCGGCGHKSINGIITKKGYPYETDVQFKNDIQSIVPPDGNIPESTPNDNIILVTHCGPSCSHTSLEFPPGQPIHQIGSDYLSELIESKEYNERITCLLHGHAHDSQGFVQHYHVPIINPGAVKRNHLFTLLSLEVINDKWTIIDVHFHNFYH